MTPVVTILQAPLRVEFVWSKPRSRVVVGAFKRLKGPTVTGGRIIAIEQTAPDGTLVNWEDGPSRPRPGAAERDGLAALIVEAEHQANRYLAATKSPPLPKRPVGRPKSYTQTTWEETEYAKEHPGKTPTAFEEHFRNWRAGRIAAGTHPFYNSDGTKKGQPKKAVSI